MEIRETKLQGCFILKPAVFSDDRGSFSETFNRRQFKAVTGTDPEFVQDNQSVSKYGVLRGLHLQHGAMAQAKLVRVVKGRVIDVAVDLRKGSNTFGQHVAVELSEENGLQFFIPRGFAHGFVVLEDDTVFAYKCDNFYDKHSEGGIIYNDATLAIDWHLPKEDLIISEKDLALPSFEEVIS